MPLPPPVPRKHLHTRSITCTGYERDDGLWDIEATLTDVKTYSFPNHDRGEIKAGEPLHGMWIRITVDTDLLIHDAVAVTDHGPFTICRDIAPAYSRLIGLRIGKGFDKEVRALFDGPHGCTHLRELLRPLATTAYQTIFPARERKRRKEASDVRPGILDTCYALRTEGEVVQREWPAFYTGPAPAEGTVIPRPSIATGGPGSAD